MTTRSRAIIECGGDVHRYHHPPAGDRLGYLLQKHPHRAQSVDVRGGTAHVFCPEVHEYVFAILALESEPVDPRL
ncbi:MAG: hypothetical protein JO106_00200 [Mycobacterium sp.]|nr:hypothetical protein [Mycobacterium sp.]